MRAVVFHGVGDIRLDDVPDPQIKEPTDAIVRITASAICGTDLHLVRGTVPGMQEGTILGHEGVGVVEEVGADVRNLLPGDRVVIASTIACGSCVYCRAGYFAQCDRANPEGPLAGTAFFGGPASAGALNGLQAELARVPFANVGLVKLPDSIDDDQAVLLSDIFPTGYFAARLAEIKPGDNVAVFGAGPVGQFAVASAILLGAGRVFAVDSIATRLDMARRQGAEVIDYEAEDPVEALRRLTGGIGVDRAIDAVGVDANHAHAGPAAAGGQGEEAGAPGGSFHPGDGPAQALTWAVDALAKAGTLAIVGVYPASARVFPIGVAMNKNVTVNMGNCHHRKYIPRLVELTRTGAIDPAEVVTQHSPLSSAIEAFKQFDRRAPGWVKVKLEPSVVRLAA